MYFNKSDLSSVSVHACVFGYVGQSRAQLTHGQDAAESARDDAGGLWMADKHPPGDERVGSAVALLDARVFSLAVDAADKAEDLNLWPR